MRHSKIRPRIVLTHHTTQEKIHLRRVKRKSGPSATRRRERRAHLQEKKDEVLP